MRFRERLQRFMYGRYGMDAFGRFLSWTSIILLLIWRNSLYILDTSPLSDTCIVNKITI